MTISGSMSSALSGLAAAARAAEVVSSNIANAQTEGYGRREVQLAARTVGSTGQGVQVAGVTRAVDPAILADRRLSDAGAAGRDLRAAFHSGLETALGTPTDPASLTARLADFDAALVAAASRPDSESRLAAVLDAAGSLADTFGRVTDAVQTARTRADAEIAAQVDRANTALAQVADLNARILSLQGEGRDANALIDQRQKVIDGLAAILPLREVPRPGGQVALYTAGGAALLDGTKPAVFGFAATPMIVPGMTQANGALSGLTINGRPVATTDAGPIGGGALAAAFAVRDELAPAAQARLDGLARDLVARLADPAVDPTLAPGDAGLFTDAGGPFDPSQEAGLAGRLAVNAAADPAQGGALWRLRAGLGAAVPGAVGDSRLLTALQDALTDAREPASGNFMAGPRSLSVLAAQMVSGVSADRLDAEDEATFARTRAEAFRVLELEGGVDTDRELQNLLVIEKAYAANARVISTVDGMISLLLEI